MPSPCFEVSRVPAPGIDALGARRRLGASLFHGQRLLSVPAVLLGAVALVGAAGSHRGGLDPTFGRGGQVLTDFSPGSADMALAIAIQPNGTILAAGASATGGADSAFALARYNADGNLDPSFGTGGTALTHFGIERSAFVSAVTLQPNGKAVAVGTASVGDSADFALARYNNDGSLDARFGRNGMVLTDFGGADDAVAIALEKNGRILVAGNSDEDFALARYTADGSLDSSFGNGGKVLTDFGGFGERANAMALQANGKIVVAGGSSGDFALARYNSDGTLDAGFGSGGMVLTDFGFWSGDDAALAVAVQQNGSIVAAGETTGRFGLGTQDFALIRYNPDGSLDSTFGSAGMVATDFGASETVRAVAVRPDGTIVAVGQSDSRGWDFAVAKYQPDGSLDSSFGSGGKVLTDFAVSGGSSQICSSDTEVWPCRDDQAFAVALEPNGSIVAAGLSEGDFALARYTAR